MNGVCSNVLADLVKVYIPYGGLHHFGEVDRELAHQLVTCHLLEWI